MPHIVLFDITNKNILRQIQIVKMSNGIFIVYNLNRVFLLHTKQVKFRNLRFVCTICHILVLVFVVYQKQMTRLLTSFLYDSIFAPTCDAKYLSLAFPINLLARAARFVSLINRFTSFFCLSATPYSNYYRYCSPKNSKNRQ